ncbi:MAG: NAD-dependent epimerase/dehydratase family protein [Syntrophales bacterium]
MPLKDKKIFLAGSTGLAGVSVLLYLLRNYAETKIRASYLRTEPFINHPNVEYVRGDLTLRSDCRRMVCGCDIAIMAAAVTGGAQTAVSAPWEQVSDNVVMDVQLLHALHLENVPRAVYISTASVYQDFAGAIQEDELDMNKEPHRAYIGVGWAKRYVEKLCRFWYEKSGLQVIIARASNIYGPFAKFDPAVSHFVPALIRKAVDRTDPFEIWGSTDMARDIIYGDDFAEAIALMLEREDLKFAIFNVGSGRTTTVGDAATWALKHAGHSPKKVVYRQDQPTTVSYRSLDSTKIREKLGWEPKYSPEEGISKTVKWWIQNRDWWKK